VIVKVSNFCSILSFFLSFFPCLWLKKVHKCEIFVLLFTIKAYLCRRLENKKNNLFNILLDMS
jgi:hypothetical protein